MKNVSLTIGSILLVGGALYLITPTDSHPVNPLQSSTNGNPNTAISPVVIADPAKLFRLRVVRGKLVEGSRRITVAEGNTVILRVMSDIDEKLHVDGYDLDFPAVGNAVSDLKFEATRSGEFAYRLRASGIRGVLEVLPASP